MLPHVLVGLSEDSCWNIFTTAFMVMFQTVKILCKAREPISCGYAELFGHADATYWQTMSEHFGIDPPPAAAKQTFGLLLFGVEAEIFKGCQYMAVSWTSEQSPFWSDCMKSRFLVCLLPVHSYAMRGTLNLTVQETLKQICSSINEFQQRGLAGVYCRYVSLKGDWKWMVQALNLNRKPGQDKFCFLCNATRSMEAPMTDLNPEATWRLSPSDCPWATPPAILDLDNFSLSTVGLDILHIWHIGTGRDLASSILLVLLRRGAFPGANVAWLLCCDFCVALRFVLQFLLNFLHSECLLRLNQG